MSVDFFEKELRKAQNRFNTVFCELFVCNLKVRQTLILAITWMGVLKRKIHEKEDKDLARDDIRKFVKYRNLVNDVFNNIESELEERRPYDNPDDNQSRCTENAIG